MEGDGATDPEAQAGAPEGPVASAGAPDGPVASAGDHDGLVARYVAAGGFVASAWLGAGVLVASFAQFYWASLSKAYPVRVALVLGLVMMVLGGALFLRSRSIYRSLDVAYRRRSMAAATVVAGSGGVFWLLYAFLLALVLAGVDILPA